MSDLLASLHALENHFQGFRATQRHVRDLYIKTKSSWHSWQHQVQEIQKSRAARHRAGRERPEGSDNRSTDEEPAASFVIDFENSTRIVRKLLEEPPKLIVVGQLKSGKSSLINLILQQHVLPTDEGPCTGRMVVLKALPKSDTHSKPYLRLLDADHGDVPSSSSDIQEVEMEKDGRLTLPDSVIFQDSFKNRQISFRKPDEGDDLGSASSHPAWVELYYPHKLLEVVEIVDSPGMSENDNFDRLVRETLCSGLVQTIVYAIDGCEGFGPKDSQNVTKIQAGMAAEGKQAGQNIVYVCTKIDQALRVETEEPLPTFIRRSSSDSENDSSDDSEDDTYDSSVDVVTAACNGPAKGSASVRYDTKIHQRVFNQLTRKGAGNFLPEYGNFEDCPLFHCLSAYQVADDLESKTNSPFVCDFNRFLSCLSKRIADDLDRHLANALRQLIAKQQWLIEVVLDIRLSLARRVLGAEEKTRFLLDTEKKVYDQLTNAIKKDRLPVLKSIIREQIDSVQDELLNQVADLIIVSDPTSGRRKNDQLAAKQVHEFMVARFNDALTPRLASVAPALALTGALTKCMQELQDAAGRDLATVRCVQQLIDAAYQPVMTVAKTVSIPFRLIIRRLFDLVADREIEEVYTKSWKTKIGKKFIEKLNPVDLAKDYCSQLQQTLSATHKEFMSSMKSLQEVKEAIIQDAITEKHQLQFGQAFDLTEAYLQCRSMSDTLSHGQPKRGKLIRNGLNSAVYLCSEGKWGDCKTNSVIKARGPWPPPQGRDAWPSFLYLSSIMLPHPNVQQTAGFLFPTEEPNGKIWVIEELVESNLEDVINNRIQLDHLAWLKIGSDVIEGLVHLQRLGIPHYNLKPSNILLDGIQRAKVSDIGMYDISQMKQGKLARNVYFVAPEMWREGEDATVTDIYAVGILLWYLFSGYLKGPGDIVHDPVSYQKLVDSGISPDDFVQDYVEKQFRRPELTEWGTTSQVLEAGRIMAQCWHSDVAQRYNADKLQHRYEQLLAELIPKEKLVTVDSHFI